jgi:autotransporter-associated beta strand protein
MPNKRQRQRRQRPRRRSSILPWTSIALILPVRAALATITVEQIEAYNDTPTDNQYAAVDFGGTATTVGSGTFAGVTFHALSSVNNTVSTHAQTVGGLIYGSGAPGNPYVNNVYASGFDSFFNNVAPLTNVSTAGPVPLHFAGGAKLINSSFVANETSNLDAQRRIDFMIARDDVTYVAAAADVGTGLTGDFLTWSSFNALAVRGDQDGFAPTGSPGKQHADLGMPGHASFAAAAVSGDAASLLGHAQAAGQTDALHGATIRSLLMAGADKTSYSRDTANNLGIQFGAGAADLNTSLSILGAGERPLSLVGVGGAIAGTASTNVQGWSYGTITAGSESVVLFHATNPIGTLTASLNWDVTSNQPTAGTLDTTDAGLIFPNLALELRPVTATGGGHFTLGVSSSDLTLHSDATNDNVEYLYSTHALPAGDYAFLVSGDASRSVAAALSYNVFEPPVTQWASAAGGSWATAGNWSAGLPNSAVVRADFLASPGLSSPGTITLDGSRTVGQMTFDSPQGYTITAGSGGGTLTIDDSADGTPAPTIIVNAGSHTVAVPVALATGVTINTAAGGALSLSGPVTGAGGITKAGAGSLTIGGTNTFSGDTTVSGGTLTLAAGSSLPSTNYSVSGGAALNVNGSIPSNATVNLGGGVTFAGNTSTSATLARTLAALNFGSGATATVAKSAAATQPEILSLASLAFLDSTSKLDLTNNELLATTTVAAIKPRIVSGQIFSSTPGGELGYIDAGGGKVEARFTLPGDTNLDGVVNAADLGNLIVAYGVSSGAIWLQGDFDYNSNVNVADLADLVVNYQMALPAAMTAEASASPADVAAATVPEPGMIGALGVSSIVVAAFGRRRRRHRSLLDASA